MNLIASLVLTLLATTPSRTQRRPWLRIIQINDVYELDNFPRLKTLIDQHQHTLPYNNSNCENDDEGPDSTDDRPDVCITVCAGDFLSPSLLSSLDKGRGMVDILN